MLCFILLCKLSKLPPNHNVSTTRQQWIVAGTVDKRTLRREVQDFCGQFSIYRLEPYVPFSVSVVASDEGQSHTGKSAQHKCVVFTSLLSTNQQTVGLCVRFRANNAILYLFGLSSLTMTLYVCFLMPFPSCICKYVMFLGKTLLCINLFHLKDSFS